MITQILHETFLRCSIPSSPSRLPFIDWVSRGFHRSTSHSPRATACLIPVHNATMCPIFSLVHILYNRLASLAALGHISSYILGGPEEFAVGFDGKSRYRDPWAAEEQAEEDTALTSATAEENVPPSPPSSQRRQGVGPLVSQRLCCAQADDWCDSLYCPEPDAFTRPDRRTSRRRRLSPRFGAT